MTTGWAIPPLWAKCGGWMGSSECGAKNAKYTQSGRVSPAECLKIMDTQER